MSRPSILVILGTTRRNNLSSNVAQYILSQLQEVHEIKALYFDLGKSDFPLLVDRPSAKTPITDDLQHWIKCIGESNGIVIVSPEYKSGYPGSLKNFLDYLPAGIFRYKAVGICTVSSGPYAGTSCLQQLRQVVISMAGTVIPDRFQVGTVSSAFDNRGMLNSEQHRNAANKFLTELLKYTSVLTPLQNT